eukprot:CAMPEP_0197183922 /NCGR_PEP_ID=MMETSP1423-20130617/8763_1 /TAXON_ID=476441 /ORGANISM="Pseudo-nitzschia heimii, Strain UNC1101" /LENGTH=398 /DNA_ID=CAMNT_0042634599 /DNA_START=150 /DNA_END=1346 /DNA_ORIENTATION=+
MFTTFGLLVLTALYIGMVVALHYKSPRDCLLGDNVGYEDASCQSEGVDNTILNWASDFFVAFWTFVFGLHLSVGAKPNTGVRKSGILSQVFMGGAFAMAGVGNWLYPNSGADDGHGMVAYWIVQIFVAVFFAASGIGMAQFTLNSSRDTDPNLKTSVCAEDRLVLPCVVLLMMSMIGFLAGSIMCSLETDIQTTDKFDDYEPTIEPLHVCFAVAKYSEAAMNLAYALLWLPVGSLLRATAQEEPKLVLGLPTPIAAMIAMLTQWTVGSILLLLLFWMDLGSAKPDNNFDAWNAIYGTVLYHWGMLTTLYCFHNLSFGLPLYYEDEEDGPTPLSWEWWVAMVAGTVSEPKQIDSDDEEEMKEADRKEFFEDKSSRKTSDSDVDDDSLYVSDSIVEEISI